MAELLSNKPRIDLWASFLSNEKLTPQRVPDVMVLVTLCEELAKRDGPRVRPHALRLKSRELVCETALDLSIDLAGIKHNGKMAMARSLLDAWNLCYARRFGAIYGTAGWREDKRRNCKITIHKPSTSTE